jgi:hypothetical protein
MYIWANAGGAAGSASKGPGRVEEQGVHLYGAGRHGHGVVVEAQVLTNVAGLSLLGCCVVRGRVEP